MADSSCATAQKENDNSITTKNPGLREVITLYFV